MADTSIDDETAVPIIPPAPVRSFSSWSSIEQTLDAEQKTAFSALCERTRTLFATLNMDAAQQAWADGRCLRRFLTARSWNVDDAATLLQETLEWRTKRGVWTLFADRKDTLRVEMETGKMYRCGKDKLGRPIAYIRDRRQNSKDYVGQIDCVIHLLERLAASMDEDQGVEQWVLVFDFRGYSNANRPPISMCRETLDIFMAKYPERLGMAFFVNPGWLMSAFWSTFSVFVPHETKSKVQFVSGSLEDQRKALEKCIDPEQIEAMFGGELNNKYVHKLYWEAECKGVEESDSFAVST